MTLSYTAERSLERGSESSGAGGGGGGLTLGEKCVYQGRFAGVVRRRTKEFIKIGAASLAFSVPSGGKQRGMSHERREQERPLTQGRLRGNCLAKIVKGRQPFARRHCNLLRHY